MSRGKHTYPDGSTYEGDVEGGKRHGQGVWIKTDGTKYAGQWKNDKPDGQGTITWPDGRKYTGYWKSGRRHGQGADIFPDGKRVEGIWEDGELVRKIEPELQDDEYFEDLDETYDEAEPDYKSQGQGFLKSLFDVSMKEMITPKIIRVLFIIGLIGIGLGILGALGGAIFAVSTSGIGALLISLITIPIGAFVAVIFLRIYLELIILLFNIHDQLKDIREAVKRK